MHSRSHYIRELRRAGLDPVQIVTQLELRETLKGCESVLDVGCGPASPLRLMGFKRLAGIEGYLPGYEAAKATRSHLELVLGDIRKLGNYFKPGEFDACVALDVIEHLTKEDGLKLMAAMENVASKKVVFFTPNGFLPQRHAENDDLQLHLSGWEAGEMRGRAYRVRGSLGPKCLRGEGHCLKYRPRAFWAAVSLVGHGLFTRWSPQHAAAILCVKECRAG
jgi:SAM-dependent methyltransferase